MRIYGTTFVDPYKTVGGNTMIKSLLIVQNYRDKEATSISTKSTTVYWLSQLFKMPLAGSFLDNNLYLRDISHAYSQYISELDRRLYLRPPPEIGWMIKNYYWC